MISRARLVALGCGVLAGCAAQPPQMASTQLPLVRDATETLTDTPGVTEVAIVYDDEGASALEVGLVQPTAASLPEPVRRAASAAVEGRALGRATWVVEATGFALYRVESDDGSGQPCVVRVSESGELIDVECALGPSEALPAAVSATADRLAPGARLYVARRHGPGTESFIVHARPSDRVQVLEIAADGTLLEHRVRYTGVIDLPFYGQPSAPGAALAAPAPAPEAEATSAAVEPSSPPAPAHRRARH